MKRTEAAKKRLSKNRRTRLIRNPVKGEARARRKASPEPGERLRPGT